MEVDISYGRSKLDKLQRELFLLLLNNAKKNLATKEKHEINILKLASCGYTNDTEVNEHLRALLQTCLIFTDNDQGRSVVAMTSLISETAIEGHKLVYGFNSFLREKLSKPEWYSYIEQMITLQFKTRYALALYMMCLKHHTTPEEEGRTPFIDLATLQKELGCTGEKSYAQYNEFNRSVLKKAIKEINTKSSLHLLQVYKRQANTITEIQFIITPMAKYKSIMSKADINNIKRTGDKGGRNN